jgi:hypothetical protein
MICPACALKERFLRGDICRRHAASSQKALVAAFKLFFNADSSAPSKQAPIPNSEERY